MPSSLLDGDTKWSFVFVPDAREFLKSTDRMDVFFRNLGLIFALGFVLAFVAGGLWLFGRLFLPPHGPASPRRIRARLRHGLIGVLLFFVAPVVLVTVARFSDGGSLLPTAVFSLPGLIGCFIYTMLLRRLNRIELRRAFGAPSRAVGR